MESNTFLTSLRLATAALATAMLAPACANSPRTPIQHVIIVVGDMDTLIKRMQASKPWDSTAIFITFDEGGGYYDSGYIQPIDFFGDGARVPLIVVSRFAKKGYVDHTYSDHASLLKFIEENWSLRSVSKRSRDNLSNPQIDSGNSYLPLNRPATGDLMSLFAFTDKN